MSKKHTCGRLGISLLLQVYSAKKIGGFFLDVFWHQCETMYQPDRFITLDEMMVRFTGSTGMKYNQHKPIPEGLKVYVLGFPLTASAYTFALEHRNKTTTESHTLRLYQSINHK